MLTDSSLTNIFLVSGVSQIRYRVYCQECKQSELVDFLKNEASSSNSNNSSSFSSDDLHKHLVKAFRQLVQLNIPCTWRVATQQEEQVKLELWVFWFDDRHTGEIDDNLYLQNLEETKMGSFTWESAIAKSLSPTASPRTPSTNVNSSILSVSLEYRLFIKSIKNLIRASMLRKGAVPLGEFFIFPSTFIEEDVCSDILSTTPDLSVATLLACTYNIYLTNTNLVVQPDTRRIRLRPLTARDLDISGTSVITCPYGEQATIIRSKHDIPHSLEEQTLQHWSSLLDIPLPPSQFQSYFNKSYAYSQQHSYHTPTLNNNNDSNKKHPPRLQHHQHHLSSLPPLIPLRMSKSGDIILYPLYLTYISTSVPISPVSIGGMNGILGYNQGYTEDLGEKWSRWAWSDQIKEYARRNRPGPHPEDVDNESQNNSNNFWDYGSPKMSATSSVLDILSIAETSNPFPSGVLQRALNEPIGSSPIMVSKAVATPVSASGPPKSESNEIDACNNNNNTNNHVTTPSSTSLTPAADKSRAEQYQHQSQLSVADFAKLNFGNQEDEEQQKQSAAMVEDTQLSETSGFGSGTTQQQDMTATTTENANENILQTPVATATTQSEQVLPAANNNSLTDSSVLLSGVSSMVMNTNDGTASPAPVAAADDDGFGFGIDGLDGSDNIYGTSNRWGDPMEDLDNLDFNVTEEDFDFFKNPPMKQEQSVPPPSSVPPAPVPETTTSLFDTNVRDGLGPQQQNISEQPQLSNDNEDTLMLMGLTDVGNEEIDLDALFSKGGILGEPLLMPDTTESTTATTMTSTDPIKIETDLVQQSLSGDSTLSLSAAVDTTAITTALPVVDEDEKQNQKQEQESKLTTIMMPSPPTLIIEAKAEQRFVPPEFAPIKFSEGVNDSKYSEGGKFMYIPTPKNEDEKQLVKQRAKLKRDNYRPDYVPRLRKRPRIKGQQRRTGSPTAAPIQTPTSLFMYRPIPPTTTSVTATTQPQTTSTSVVVKEEPLATNNTMTKTTTGMDEDHDDTSSDSDETGSTSTAASSSSSAAASNDSAYSSNKNNHDEPDWWMATMNTTQMIITGQFFKKQQQQQRQSMIHINRMSFEFDSPFPSTTAYGPLKPKSLNDLENAQEDLRVLDYLCQQVVMGGYPFTSGITAISANGGEVPRDESSTVLVSRRRALLQRYQGDVTHVPSLPSDYDKVTQEFKNILGDLFDHSKIVTDSMDQMNVMPSTVAVKGPLSVQQYYDLSETSQAQTKYGKYQVKKRRPAEPNLDTLSPPDIVVGRQDEFLEGSPKLVTFWEKLRLEPYSARKNIRYFVVFPSNEQLEPTCTQFFKGLSTLYETCHLGVHQPGRVGSYRRGLVPVPLLPESMNESWMDRQLRSYSAECQNLGSALGGAMVENMHIVIYIVNPTHNLSSNLELSRCFHKLMMAYHAASMGMPVCHERRARLVFQLIPLEHILRSSSFGGYPNFGLKDIAFSVYSKCHSVVGRNHTSQSGIEDTRPATIMYSPPFILAKQIPDSIHYTLKNTTINSFPTIMDQNATLHMTYCFSLDRQWMILVWTDNQGEMLEFSVIHIMNKPLSHAIDEAWRRTKELAQCTGFAWTLVISKMGLMFEDELQAWMDAIPTADEKVAIVSVDIDSALRVHTNSNNNNNQGGMNQQVPVMDYPQTPGSSANTPTPETFSAAAASTATTPLGTPSATTPTGTTIRSTNNTLMDPSGDAHGEIKALLLNHRVAYSKIRTQVTQGVVNIANLFSGSGPTHNTTTSTSTAAATIMNGENSSNEEYHWMLPLATGYLICSTPKTENPCREQFNNEPLVMDIHLVYNQTSHSAYSTLRDIIKRYHALSFVSMTPSSSSNCLPFHMVIAERLERVLLAVNTITTATTTITPSPVFSNTPTSL
ncbi:mediator complex subunit 13 C-terminal-domain-containing protein [Phascolomyces articulosus]|uniref:Mediator of RNA polymerase II transcription subunit 13 n=1 Tax=Phascolomyces articulosus TaxID=60185 RepID=A0AAD5JSU3_9FUNG|nr:mediator complex subunit 13 C-terminal-domain-containing protein [Phascolomyces articulosus]